MANKLTFTKMIDTVQLISCPISDFQDQAAEMLRNHYEPIGAVSTLLKDNVIICTQLWGRYDYVDQNGNYHDYPWEEEQNYWGDDDYDGDD